MRVFVALIALATLAFLPTTLAKPQVPDQVGPCAVNVGYYWPGEAVGVRCDAAGTTVGASYGTCSLGHYVIVRAGRLYVEQPCGPW